MRRSEGSLPRGMFCALQDAPKAKLMLFEFGQVPRGPARRVWTSAGRKAAR